MALRDRMKSFFVGSDSKTTQLPTMSPEQLALQKKLISGMPDFLSNLTGGVQNPYSQLSPYEPGFQKEVEQGAYRDLAQNQRQLRQSLGPHKYAAAMGSANLRSGLAGQLARMRQGQYQSERGMEFAGAGQALGAQTARTGIAGSLYGNAFKSPFENVFEQGGGGLFGDLFAQGAGQAVSNLDFTKLMSSIMGGGSDGGGGKEKASIAKMFL